MTIEAGQQLSHYRLIEKIGEGGMGVVWKVVELCRRELNVATFGDESYDVAPSGDEMIFIQGRLIRSKRCAWCSTGSRNSNACCPAAETRTFAHAVPGVVRR